MKREEILHTELIQRIKQGDQNAFELLFKLYHTPLCHYAKVYVKHIDIADDIVQDTFIRIWESRSGLDPSQSLKAYFYRCVHNNCINYLRKKQVDNRLTEEYRAEIQKRYELLERNFNESSYEKLAVQELELSIQKSIDSLPGQCREVFILSRYYDLSYQQIADKLSVSINTVKTQVSRALDKIRNDLKVF